MLNSFIIFVISTIYPTIYTESNFLLIRKDLVCLKLLSSVDIHGFFNDFLDN